MHMTNCAMTMDNAQLHVDCRDLTAELSLVRSLK